MKIADSFLMIAFNSVRFARRSVAKVLSKASRFELAGDREIEWSFVAASIHPGSGKALDFGPGPASYLGLIAARRGFQVAAVDLQDLELPYFHPNLDIVKADILTVQLPAASFDLILNCSAVEHVGLRGRYGVTEANPDGDLQTMARLRDFLKPKGAMLLTIPVGQDAVFPPLHRVYGRDRLLKLLDGYQIIQEEYWLKNEQTKKWTIADKNTALDRAPQRFLYGLGCFHLTR